MRSPILRDIPDAFETSRLLIRSPMPGDGPEVNAAVVETIDSLRVWMPWAKTLPTVDESEETMRKARCAFLERSDLWLLLFLKGTSTLVGSSGLAVKDWSVPKFEIGYWCRKRFEGQGFISEAVRGITTFAFETLGARRVEIRCDSRNIRSRRVAVRAGYPLEGKLRNDTLNNEGALRSTLVFAMISADYEALQVTNGGA
jgi:RimJ/RimL family protein N-acetyltransferase